jgi:hypothetical protein
MLKAWPEEVWTGGMQARKTEKGTKQAVLGLLEESDLGARAAGF